MAETRTLVQREKSYLPKRREGSVVCGVWTSREKLNRARDRWPQKYMCVQHKVHVSAVLVCTRSED